MYLKELEIFGFKSFPEKTILKFDPGISVVVGPNGCGKSNLLDALKWSLGDQSPKSLRATKMEDVIFNGTENYPALSYAEVVLTFDNSDHYLPMDYKEVSVSRRIYRSGESEYYINKTQVRLKDVSALFMGTGIGESTYSFVEQGKIEIFVGNKPEEKRLIFDEASGIIKYKESKKETLKNLQEAEENLLRIDDVFSEVKRQIRFLERQVEKAEQYKNCKQALIDLEQKIATIKFNELMQNTNGLVERLNFLTQEEENKTQQIQADKIAIENLNQDWQNLRKKLEDAVTLTAALNSQIESHFSHIEVCRKRMEELKIRNNNISQTEISLNERLSLANSRIIEENRRLEEIVTNNSQIDSQISNVATNKENINNQCKVLDMEIDGLKSAILTLEIEKTNINNSIIEIQTESSALNRRKERILTDKDKLQGLLAQLFSDLIILETEVKDKESLVYHILQERDKLLVQQNNLATAIEETKNKIIEKEKELVELIAYYEFLKDLRVKYDTFSVKQDVTIFFKEEPKEINKLVASLKDVQFVKEEQGFKATLEAKVIYFKEEELDGKINNLKSEIEKFKQTLIELNKELQINKELLIKQVNDLEEKEGNKRAKINDRDNAKKEAFRLEEEKTIIDNELLALEKDIADYSLRQNNLEVDFVAKTNLLSQMQTKLVALELEKNGALDKIKELDIEIAKIDTYKQSLLREKESMYSKIAVLEEEKLTTSQYLEELKREREDNIGRINSWEQDLAKLDVVIEEKKGQINLQTDSKKLLEEEESNLNKILENKRNIISFLDKDIEKIKTEIYNKKLEEQSLEYEKNKIKDYLRQVYDIEFVPVVLAEPEINVQTVLPAAEESESISAESEIASANSLAMTAPKQTQSLPEPQDLTVLLEEKEKLKKRLGSLGEVNLACFDEFGELKKRGDFLERQKEDLVNSKENLKKAINKINATCREVFLEVFNKVEEEFKNNFRYLFGGGRARLYLVNPEDILDSGVEIEVQPPGKKLQNVTLLSGGEKALTATALIFAIFKVKPSPICVLDEIDAPLDEANVGRFNSILKDFSSHSQYLVITHNKRTMSTGDVLYGVTMQEKGVSKIVSVNFSQVQANQEALK